MIAYYINSNFASQYLLDIFSLFLIVRPSAILVYTTFVTLMDTHKTWVRRRKYVRMKKLDEQNFEYASKIRKQEKGAKKLQKVGSFRSLEDEQLEGKQVRRSTDAPEKQNDAEGELAELVDPEGDKMAFHLNYMYEDSDDEDFKKTSAVKTSKNYLKEIEFEHPEMASYQELFWQFFFMPAIIFSGLGRLVVVSDRKTTVGHFSMAQELFLFTIPLGYLVYYNTELV